MSAQPKPTRRKSPETGKHLFLIALMVVELLPLYMMLQISVKDNSGFLASPWLPSDPSTWRTDNYVAAARLILPYVANTLFVAGLGTVLSLSLALCGAYFFARYRLPGSGVLWSVFMILMLMPGIANIVPLFTLLRDLNLLNTLWALITVAVAGAQAFNLFVLRGFIEEIPKDLFEAAEIDGANHLQQMLHIVLPLSGSILGTLGILAFLNQWNEFLLPLIVLRDKELFTLGVGLIYLDGEYVKQWGQIMAAYTLAALPLILMFLFTMRLFVKGLAQGAVKG